MAWLKRHGWLVAACLVGLALPKLATMIGQEFYISVASRVLIWALLATSLNLLVGTGLRHRFGLPAHAGCLFHHDHPGLRPDALLHLHFAQGLRRR